jgi:putative transposase
MDEIGRKHPPHFPAIERHNTPVIVFLTVCTKNRKAIFANAVADELLRTSWDQARSWLVGRYVVMPDHIHLFCAPADFPPKPLTQWVNYWKSHCARHCKEQEDARIWQRHFWDTQLRRGDNYDEKWEYVVQNPVRAGLVARAEDWPYQGELNILRW